VFPIFKGDKTKAVCDEFIASWREIILESPYFTPTEWFAHIGKEKGQGIIYAEEANEIIRKLNLKTFEAEYKCMIIWLPEKMNIIAANKVLKILEEPPQKTVFILITEEVELILPTMFSRCQVMRVPPISDNSLYTALSGQYQLPEHEIKSAVLMAGGNYIKAAELLENNEDNKLYLENFISVMRLAYGRKIMEMIDWSESIARLSGENQKGFLNYMLKSVRENFLITSGVGGRTVQSPDEKAFSEKFHQFINERNIFRLTEEIEKAHLHIVRNGKAKIVFFDMALSIMQLIRS
jgi:DNA polymerase-3 subunit delta'